MKTLPTILGVTVLLGGGGYYYLSTHPEALPADWTLPRLDGVVQHVHDTVDQVRRRGHPVDTSRAVPKAQARGPRAQGRSSAPITSGTSAHQVRLYLTNGDWVSGELVRETPQEVVLRWDYGEVSFSRREIQRLVQDAPSAAAPPAAQADARPQTPRSGDSITLHLKNGGSATGELLHDMPEQIVLRMDYGEIVFARSEIERVVTNATPQGTGESFTMPWEHEHMKVQWPYRHAVAVKLLKGTVLDASIARVTPDTVVLTQATTGGGQVEQTIARADIDELMFRPMHNERSEQIKHTLETVFPAMHWYDEGMFTIVTDSPPPTVKEYRRTIRALATEWYLTFFALTHTRTPLVQQHIVIFENWGSYIEYAATDGIPGWLAVGYFHPEDQVLYAFNMVGERFSDLLSEVYLGQFRRARDQVSQRLQGAREAVFIEGQISEFLQKLETAHSRVRQMFAQMSTDVLRHELTHAMFQNWQLQHVTLSQLPAKETEEVEKKRQFLQATDQEQKRQLLDALLSSRSKEPLTDVRASNSWLVEGLAGFMEPSPVGGVNVQRLSELQQARQAQRILPLEFLNTFRMGSFPRMSTDSMLFAYAQSWGMCHFLLSRYPEGFLAFLDRLAREQPKDQDEELRWLLEALGKEQRPLEQEFLAHVEQFPPEDPFWLKQMQAFLDLRGELDTLARRLWSR